MECNERDDIPNTSQVRRAMTECERCMVAISDVEGYEGEDCDIEDKEEDASQSDGGSTQNMEDRGHRRMSNGHGNESENRDHVDEEENASQADNGSTDVEEASQADNESTPNWED